MHILLLTPGFPENEYDCRCIPPLQEYCKSLFSLPDVHISVVTLQYPAIDKEYVWNKIKVYPCCKGPGRINQLRTWSNALKIISKIHNHDQVSLIHSFWMSEAALIGKVASTFFRIPTLVTLMGQDACNTNKYLKLGPLSKSIIAISSRQADLYKANTGHRILKIIPWGISSQDHKELPQANTDSRDLDLLGVGSLIPIKNYLDFVEVVAQIALTFPHVKACLIGAGPEKKELHEKIQEEGLEQNLRLEGSLPRKQVLEYMARSKVLLHPALYEGQGYVFYEALSKGCRIVSYPVGIAKQSENWEVCDDLNHMVRFLKNELFTDSKIKGTLVPSMQETVDSYHRTYEILTSIKSS